MTYYTRLCGLLVASMFSCALMAQSGNITGQLLNQDGKAADFANVLLLQASDSTLVKMELSEEDGSYEFRSLDQGEYLIKVTGIGYDDHFTAPFSLANKERKVVPVITLEVLATVLDAVEVVARKPLLEQRAGKLVVNVDQSITGQGGSVTDLLKKVPGLVVVNDRVSMAGRNGVTILIDGRPTKYMDIQSVLNEMPADNIAKIEVVTQPGAAYDAEGTGGIINIILKKNALYGTNGSVTAGFGYGELAKYRIGTNLNHRTGPWNLTFATGYNNRTWIERLDLTRVLEDRTYVQNNYEPGNPHSLYLNMGADYDINANHRVGISLNSYRSDNDRTSENTTTILSNEGNELDKFTTRNMQDRFWRSYTTDAFYRWQIDTTGQELNFDINMADYRREVTDMLMTTGENFDDRQNQTPANTRIYATQVDYKLPINDQMRFEAGAKLSATRLDNELLATVRLNDEWVNDPLLSNKFNYEEDIYAAYVNLSYTKGEYDANFGLRYEDSQASGYSATLDSTINLNIAKLFPSLSLTTPFIGPLGTSISYSYRIERPGYFDLNPFVSYLDPLTFSKGNPFLVPELTHTGQFSLTYEKQPFFNLSYDYTKDVLTEVIEQNDETGEAFQTDINLDKYIRYGGSLFFPLDFIAKPISGYGGIMVFYHDYQAEYLNADYLQNQWTTNAFLQVNVSLPQDWKLEVTGWMQGAGLDGIIRHETFYGLDAGIQKKFFDNKLRIQLSVDGIVQKFFEGRVDYANLDFDLTSSWEAPVFNARVTYNFGNQSLKSRERRESSSDTERNRVNGN
ncbi:outer membrane beta-barrel protein [Lewinella cohaerens]|uniref:outer membrane beta-barrel protein n=1 Tax=Lewinella cohaerens TaxID=70995 RepID=UPI00036C29F9|nr:outer membrane beta-barrel protein [Lewinella cohaerens]